MPGASTPTLLHKVQIIGMGLRAYYHIPVSQPNTGISNQNIDDIQDTKRQGACCCTQYNNLDNGDIDEGNEQALRSQFPRFSNRIHKLIEDRRAYRERSENANSGCNIL